MRTGALIGALYCATPEPSLTVEAEGCATSEEVEHRIRAMVGADALDEHAVDIRIRTAAIGERWSAALEITIDGTASTRTLEAESCGAAVDASTLVAALAIDPTANPELAPQPPPGSAELSQAAPAKPPEPVRREGVAASPTAKPRERIRWAADAGLGVAGGVIPAAMGTVRGSAEIGRRRFMFGGGATYGWPTRVSVGADAAAQLQLWTIDARGCFVVRPRGAPRLAIPICPTVRAGAMLGRGDGEGINVREGTAAWVGAGALASVRYVSPYNVGVFFSIEGTATLLRPSFQIDRVGRACCRSPIAGLVVAGVSFGDVPRKNR